jgi:hypothetical protein
MSNSEKPLTERESLDIIQRMISQAKNSYYDSGTAPLMWGIVVFVCSIIWLLTFIAIAPQVYISIREKKNRPFKSYNDQFGSYIWGGFGICIFILTFYQNRVSAPYHITTLYMMLYGLPTFITGGLMNFRPMLIGGLICWVCAIGGLFLPYKANIILLAVCALSAWLIPGLILRAKFLKEKHV